jgi:DNA repair protein RecN (Recombination protein N)
VRKPVGNDCSGARAIGVSRIILAISCEEGIALMLVELKIANFAIIEEQSVHFGPGLNVLSGETGAGKSIILSALELILGGRPRPHAVRHGADSLEVEALFDLTRVHERTVAELPDCARGDELSIVRSVSASGRGRVYINGRIGTVALLEEIVSRLVNICGQSHHVRLLDPGYHLALLDSFAGNEDLVSEYGRAFGEYRALLERVQSREEDQRRLRARREDLLLTIKELSAVELTEGIRQSLEERVVRLANAERLLAGVQSAGEALTDDQGALNSLRSAIHQLSELGRLDPMLAPIIEQLSSCQVLIREGVRDIDSYAGSLEVDQQQLEQLREQLAEVARLERKYRTNDGGLVALLKEANEELLSLEDESRIELLQEKLRHSHAESQRLAQQLSARRNEAGKELASRIEQELVEVNMKGARLVVELSHLAELAASGSERGEFLLASNRGEALRPLRQIASGGELSRILLVCKKVLRDRSGVNVLVFDEVDTGISGSVARAVGLKLKALAQDSQVLCITHLPQVASLADTHLLVTKIEADRTRSVVRTLSREERITEIARMLAGAEITAAARESARELLGA